MGFWGGLGKLVAGKPVFEESRSEGHDDGWENDAPTTDYAEERQAKKEESRGLYDESGVKQIPEAGVIHVKYNLSGTNVEVWATVRNHSTRNIELDKIMICGQKRELDYPLSPGAEREFSVYKGPFLMNDGYKRAELYYKDVQTGDYFRADHVIEYHYDAQSRAYHVNSLELIRPIYDV